MPVDHPPVPCDSVILTSTYGRTGSPSQFVTRGRESWTSRIHSCPDLSLPEVAIQDPSTSSSEIKQLTGSTREALILRSESQHSAFPGKHSSSKVRHIIGRALAFRRMASAKMAEPSLSSTLTKRGRSSDSMASRERIPTMNPEESRVGNKHNAAIPAFLNQSYAG